jgi:hypothetical protein
LPRGVPGELPAPDDLVLSPADTLAEAQRLLDAGRPFQAHEVLEAAWKLAPTADRDLWQGLAQLAVGLTHALRGNATGAARLLDRGATRLAGYAEQPPYEIDVAGLIAWAQAAAAGPVRPNAPKLTRDRALPSRDDPTPRGHRQ